MSLQCICIKLGREALATVNLRVLVEKFTPRIVYVKSGVDFYAQTDIKRVRGNV